MSDDKVDENQIKDAVIDQLSQVIDQAREKLKTVQCKEHGQALEKLGFDRARGRFDIVCCCDAGEALVEEAIKDL